MGGSVFSAKDRVLIRQTTPPMTDRGLSLQGVGGTGMGLADLRRSFTETPRGSVSVSSVVLGSGHQHHFNAGDQKPLVSAAF